MVRHGFANVKCLTRMLIGLARPGKRCNLMEDEVFFP